MSQRRITGPTLPIYLPHALTPLQIKALDVWLATYATNIEKRRPYERRDQRHHETVRERRELLLLQLQVWRDDASTDRARDEIKRLMGTVRQNISQLWDYRLTDGTQLGSSHPITQSARAFTMKLDHFQPPGWDAARPDIDAYAHLIDVLGWSPQHVLHVTAFNGRPDDLLLLAYLLAGLVDDTGGFVPVVLRPLLHTAQGRAEWDFARQDAIARALPGRILRVVEEHQAGYHLLDGDALRGWAVHERFHLA